jgi:hypothetical protein
MNNDLGAPARPDQGRRQPNRAALGLAAASEDLGLKEMVALQGPSGPHRLHANGNGGSVHAASLVHVKGRVLNLRHPSKIFYGLAIRVEEEQHAAQARAACQCIGRRAEAALQSVTGDGLVIWLLETNAALYRLRRFSRRRPANAQGCAAADNIRLVGRSDDLGNQTGPLAASKGKAPGLPTFVAHRIKGDAPKPSVWVQATVMSGLSASRLILAGALRPTCSCSSTARRSTAFVCPSRYQVHKHVLAPEPLRPNRRGLQTAGDSRQDRRRRHDATGLGMARPGRRRRGLMLRLVAPQAGCQGLQTSAFCAI